MLRLLPRLGSRVSASLSPSSSFSPAQLPIARARLFASAAAAASSSAAAAAADMAPPPRGAGPEGQAPPRGKKRAAAAAAAANDAAAADAERPPPPPPPPPSKKQRGAQQAPPSQPGQQYWLVKSEPHEYSADDLAARKGQGRWDGVRNFSARNNLRSMGRGDLCLFYHSSCPVPGVVAVARVTSDEGGYPDPTAAEKGGRYYDEKHTDAAPRWFCVDLVLERRVAGGGVALASIKERAGRKGDADGAVLAGMALLTRPRLSVQPVTPQEWAVVMRMEKEAVAARAAAAAAAAGGAEEGGKGGGAPVVTGAAATGAAGGGGGAAGGGKARGAAAAAAAKGAAPRRGKTGGG